MNKSPASSLPASSLAQAWSPNAWGFSGEMVWNVGILQLASSCLLLALVSVNEANFRVASVEDYRVDHQVLTRLAVCGCCGLVGLASLQFAWTSLGRLPGLFACGYAVWALITAPWAYSPVQSAAGALAFGCVLLFTASVVATKSERQIVRPVLVGMTCYIVGSWIAFLVFPEFGRDPYHEAAMGGELRLGGLSHPNGTGRLCALALALTLVALRKQHVSRLFGVGLVVLSGVTLLATGSRTSLLAAACALSLLGWRVLRPGLRSTGVLALTAVVVLAVFSVGLGFFQPNWNETMSRSARGGDAEEILSLSGRTDLWHDAWLRFLERPLTGHGHGCARFVLAGRDWETHHAHHQLLNVLLTTGVIGGLCVGAALLWMAVNAICRPNDLTDVVLVLVLVVGLADVVLVQSLPDAYTLMFLVALLIRQAPTLHTLEGSQ